MFISSKCCLTLLFASLLLTSTSLWAQYEDHKKMGIPNNVEPIHETYIPVVSDRDFKTIMEQDKKQKSAVMQRQLELLDRRYDLRDRPTDLKMSGGRKAVQRGIRVKLPNGVSWQELAKIPAEEIRQKDLFPRGFLPLPHVKHQVGGQVFPEEQIEEIRKLEERSLERFDVEVDLPKHLLPEFPPPIFLNSRPDLGDVSQGKL